MRILLEHERACIFAGDSAGLGEYLPENSVDALVFDPPSAISFMGQEWDDDRGGFDGWTRWLAGVLAPAYRALKPGGHGLCWALPRTSHWAARAVELAGFEIRDVHHDAVAVDDLVAAFADTLDDAQRAAFARVFEGAAAPIFYQIFGQGFPKSLDISKAIDQHLGAERPVVGHVDQACGVFAHSGGGTPQDIHKYASRAVTAAGSVEAARWEGFGTALKPAIEHWILFRKPLDGTYAHNVLTHGTGALNIDACRIGTDTVGWGGGGRGAEDAGTFNADTCGLGAGAPRPQVGRWPAHLSLTHADGCEPVGTSTEAVAKYETVAPADRDGNGTNFAMGKQTAGAPAAVARDVYRCAPGCPVAELDAQSGVLRSPGNVNTTQQAARSEQFSKGQEPKRKRKATDLNKGDKGGASRFFYTPKASRSEKDRGLDHLRATTGGEATGREDGSAGVSNPRAGAGRTGGAKNSHPCVKSISLMEWLLKLVTPPGGTVLDPFAGSGTTGVAAIRLGMSFIGCDEGGPGGKYLPILVGRIQHALQESKP